MDGEMNVLKAVADPKDGRLVVHYRQNGGKVKKFKPADEIPKLEQEQLYHIDEQRAWFDAVLKKRKEKEIALAFSFLNYLSTERDLNLSRLDCLRLMEISFKRGVFQNDIRKLDEAMRAYWSGEIY